MANGDPLRAQEIFEKLPAEWHSWWVVWRDEKNKAIIKANTP